MAERYKRPESILVVVHTAEGEVLLLERTQPAGWWQSVTGSLLEGETPIEAAVRELQEETGLAADSLTDLGLKAHFPIRPEWCHRFAPDVAENLEHAFALTLPGRVAIRLEPGGHEAYEWLPGPMAIARATSWTDRQAIAKALGLEHVGADSGDSP